jgi:hypothetical protein
LRLLKKPKPSPSDGFIIIIFFRVDFKKGRGAVDRDLILFPGYGKKLLIVPTVGKKQQIFSSRRAGNGRNYEGAYAERGAFCSKRPEPAAGCNIFRNYMGG